MGKKESEKREGRGSKKKRKKRSNRSKSSSSSSSSTSSSSLSSIDEKTKKKLKKKIKKLKRKERQKKKEKKAMKKLMKSKLKGETLSGAKEIEGPGISLMSDCLAQKSKSLAPMTKEEWEKQQSTLKRVYDEETGRTRLIKGSGEIVEECVSRERHLAINKQATRGDGEYFQNKLMQQMK